MKAVLICSACDREAPMDDAWSLTERSDRTVVTCPECGTVVVSQPTFDEGERPLIAA
jgi:DNA-directed RNA polymerase subunit RPC12/RpoP